MPYNIYKDDELIAEGIEEKEYTVEGLEPNTEYYFSVSSVENGNESEKVTVTAATKPISVTGVTLSPKTGNAEIGTAGERQLTATVSPESATNKNVNYSIEPSTEGLSVSNTGKITWTENTPAGTYTTTVKTEDGEKTDTHVLTLKEPPEPEPDPEEGE